MKRPKSPLPDPQDCARKLDVLANATRFNVLEILRRGPQHVKQMQAALGVEQSVLSHHLRVLRDAGLVDVAVDGKCRLYSTSVACSGTGIDLGCCELRFEPEERGCGRSARLRAGAGTRRGSRPPRR